MDYLVGVDGGGTHTRVRIVGSNGVLVGHGSAGPSALGQGPAKAWHNIYLALQAAFNQAQLPPPQLSNCAFGLGLSGANSPLWRESFLAAKADGPLASVTQLILDTDASILLLGAHGENAGAILIAGTGSVGEARLPTSQRISVGGWGFPIGDEGSGAWLGWRAVQLTQAAFDNRAQACALTQEISAHCGRNKTQLLDWCAHAGQFEYAQLAPLVFAAADQDAVARQLLQYAALALESIVIALEPTQQIPVTLHGSVALRLAPQMSAALRARCIVPKGDALDGALQLIRPSPHHCSQ